LPIPKGVKTQTEFNSPLCPAIGAPAQRLLTGGAWQGGDTESSAGKGTQGSDDTIARIGGDEFNVLLENLRYCGFHGSSHNQLGRTVRHAGAFRWPAKTPVNLYGNFFNYPFQNQGVVLIHELFHLYGFTHENLVGKYKIPLRAHDPATGLTLFCEQMSCTR